ncbi:MAG: 2OG-Fe(II) oxygenase [Hyphomonas sp.]|nr:2OG-Fe(II) oxygenase [Hyphomonas sp.]MCB9972224.1 2OG-Fe(II) oxygenase [Hyphomonas sp.]
MTAMPLPPPGDNRLGAITDDLAQKGWSWQPGFLPDALYRALREDVLAIDAEDELELAGVGRDDAFLLDRSIRRSRIAWMDRSTPAQAAFLDWAETLREAINRTLMIGLFEFEACFAVYRPGGFYDRHLDSFEGAKNRVVSLVVYLNEDWKAEDGGALLVWPEGAGEEAEPVAALLPEGAGVALMLSETIPHAVAATRATRYAIAAWWRVNPSVYGRVDPLS